MTTRKTWTTLFPHSSFLVPRNTGIVDDGVCTAFFKSLEGEFVAVERLAFQGEEDASLRAVTAVGRDARMLLIEPV